MTNTRGSSARIAVNPALPISLSKNYLPGFLTAVPGDRTTQRGCVSVAGRRQRKNEGGKMQKEWAELIIHMTGCGSHIHPKSRGFRNYYCSSCLPNDEDFISLLEMEKLSYVKAGGFINDGDNQYFCATPAGCRAAGIKEKYIKRIFEFSTPSTP